MQGLNRIVWLASFPKSGNTWTRSFLAHYFMPPGQAPDINNLKRFTTADVRQDFFDKAAGGPFAARDFDHWLETRVKALRLIAASKEGHHFVKTHCQVRRIGSVDVIAPEVTAAAVYILRNPFDVAPSYARHLGVPIDEAIGHMENAKMLNASQTRIFEVIGRWDEHVRSWTEARGLPMHVMRYEDMIASPERTFRGLLGFLGVRAADGRLRKAIRATSFDALKKQEAERGFIERPPTMAEPFFTKGQAGAWKEDLDPLQIRRIREAFYPAIAQWYPELLEETGEVAKRA